MPSRTLPPRPNLEQYKKQARELLRALQAGNADVIARAALIRPRGVTEPAGDPPGWQLADAQLILAREHGFLSWPKFAAQITEMRIEQAVRDLADPIAAFLRAASVPRDDHGSGTTDEAQLILERYPQVVDADIHVAAALGHPEAILRFVQADPASAQTPGGTLHWDPLTYLCFSRYLRIDKTRSEDFVRGARILLEAGAPANTGWYETIDYPNPRQIIESAIYGAAGIAQNADLTRLLLDHGADPNDEETCYHAAENYDTAVLEALLASGKLNNTSLTTLLVRKADWHDLEGLRLVLQHGADPNAGTRWLHSGLQHAIRRDNALPMIELLLDHGADPTLPNRENGLSGFAMAAHRGRADVLRVFEQRGWPFEEESAHRVLAACALADHDLIAHLVHDHPEWLTELRTQGGSLLAEFAGNGNTDGVRCLLDLGVPVDALFRSGDGYWDVAKDSTALHVAAWRARHATVQLFIDRAAPVNALDGKGRTPLALAVRACVDSYWKNNRSPDSVRALLEAGATTAGIMIPTGYDAIDTVLAAHQQGSNTTPGPPPA